MLAQRPAFPKKALDAGRSGHDAWVAWVDEASLAHESPQMIHMHLCRTSITLYT